MPLVPTNPPTLSLSMTWFLQYLNPPFAPEQLNDNTTSYNLQGLPSTWNQLLAAYYSGITPTSTQNVDLFAFVNQVNESTGFLHALLILMIPTSTTGGIATLEPGATNPVAGIFRGTTPGIDVHEGGCFLLGQAATATGLVISSTSANLLVKNNGSGNLAFKIIALGSTT
jgi:hypothetical protein